MRAKYHLLKRDWIDIAGATLVQLGTADRDEFLGTGDSTIRPFLVFSRTFSDRFTPHLNVGYEFNLDRDPLSAFEYAVGFDYGNNKWTLAGELLSSHEPDGDGIGDNIVNTSRLNS